MCGIAGVSLSPGQKATEQHLRPLLAALAHRGPDGSGTWLKATLGLAHARLSILDVAHGGQPFKIGPQNTPLALVANGEIYNYKALQGFCTGLQTGSDCEPPLHRFAEIGEKAFDELNGMYALAVADGATETLHLATDPFGIKPLYYAQTAVGFVFASEPRAIVQAGWVRPEANLEVLPQLLNRHYSTGEQTLFKNIFRLLPGERLVVRHGKIHSRSRKLPPLGPVQEGDLANVAEAFNTRFVASVERHLQADVPYGLLLSGGLDSTALAVAMRELGAPLHAYTAHIQVKEGPNEATVAEEVCRKLGATHTTVPYTEADFWPALARFAWAMDDLTTDYAALPLMKLTARAREDVKILLSGEGGDEMLAGYSSYRKPQGLLRAFLKSLKKNREGDAAPHAALFRIPVSGAAALRSSDPPTLRSFSSLQRRQLADVGGWLPHDLLLKLDRTTMMNGIEGRVPFLDDTFAAWAFSLPDDVKVRDNMGKHILRRHLEAKGFAELAWARKQGFSVAVGSFLRHKPHLIAALWQGSPLLNDILYPTAAEKLLGGLNHAKAANLALSLTVLALWHNIHVEGHNPATVAEELAAAPPLSL